MKNYYFIKFYLQQVCCFKRIYRSCLNAFYSALFILVLSASGVLAESSKTNEAVKRFFPASYAGSIFDEKLTKPIEIKKDVESEEALAPPKENESLIEFQTSDITKKKFLPPDQTPSVAVNPDAPSSVISMIESSRRGDDATAKGYAKQFVRTLQNYFFEVRKITSLIGEALVEETAIEDEDWIGAAQAIDIELAKTRLEKGILIKPSQDVAMKRIIADPKKEVLIYYLFSRSCSYCRFMASDVERLRRAFSEDSRVKFTGLVVGESSEAWLKEFRNYTGMTIPVYDGTEFAKSLNLGFFPVLLVVSPNGKRSYFKSGQQTFERMYEFVRTTQGLPVEDNLYLQSIIKTPIGSADKLILAQGLGKRGVVSENFGEKQNVNLPKDINNKYQVDKF